MQDVWDNPHDEVWNRIPTNAPIAANRSAQLKQAQALFQQLVPIGSASVADELIAERRLEASTLMILTIPRPQAPTLPDAACWPVADLAFLNPPQWRERALVETDETQLQPVAYGVLLNDAGHVWCYQRAGGDARVDGRYSCGVGGHVDAQDASPHAFHPEATLRTAWLRELAEELQADSLHLADVRLHGLVYEGLSAIGRVHLGVVFVARWCGPTPPQPTEGEALHALGFLPLAHIATDTRFELWSRLVAQQLLTSLPA